MTDTLTSPGNDAEARFNALVRAIEHGVVLVVLFGLF